LNHPGVVAVYDVIAPTGDHDPVYIVMEHVEAPTLGDLIDRQGPLPAPRVAAMGAGILDALMAAHAMGIVHRDVKPSNVMVRDGDRVKLADFGIALAAEDTRLTRSGVMGTQAYLAPEAFDTGQVGPAADLWALGATLFHAVAGRAPFARDTATATLRAILFEDPPAPPGPPALGGVIAGLLTRSVDQRLTGDVARRELERATIEPADPLPAPAVASTGGFGQGTWRDQATSVNPSPTPTPTSTPGPFATTQPSSPGGFPPPANGPAPPGPPGLPGPTTGPGPGGPWAGPPARPNYKPLVIGGVIAAVAVLLLVVMMSGGGSDSDGGGDGEATATSAAGFPDVPTPGASSDATTGATTGADPGGTGDTAGSEAAAQAFIDAVNSGDEGTASGMLCPDNRDVTEPALTAALAGEASLEIDPAETESDDSGTWARLAGTVDGASTDSAFMTTSNTGGGTACVMQFDLGQA
jgi:hypothetical protein